MIISNEGVKQLSAKEASRIVANDLRDFWISCNVYPKSIEPVVDNVLDLHTKFGKFKDDLRKRKNGPQYDSFLESKVKPWILSLDKVLDIVCKNSASIKKMENQFRIMMEDSDSMKIKQGTSCKPFLKPEKISNCLCFQ